MFDFDDDNFVHRHPQGLKGIRLPALVEDNPNREGPIQQQQEDTTLADCRRYTDTGERRYYWDKGLLVLKADDVVGQPVTQVILPQARRKNSPLITPGRTLSRQENKCYDPQTFLLAGHEKGCAIDAEPARDVSWWRKRIISWLHWYHHWW